VTPPKGVPRDEWLLAFGLAVHTPGVWKYAADVAIAIDPTFGPEFEAAWNAAWAVRSPRLDDRGDAGHPDAYAAGAALALALEEDA
jgi:hypothetical protein